MKSSLVLMAGLAAIAIAAPAPASAAASRCPSADALPVTVAPESFAGSVLCLLNQERAKHRLKPLRENMKLAQAATGHSSSMLSKSYFAHDDPAGSTFSSRVLATGYTRGARRWLIGENLAWGTGSLGTPQALVIAWMNSPPHRENILQPRFQEIGLGIEWGTPSDANAQGGAIVTTDFGLTRRR